MASASSSSSESSPGWNKVEGKRRKSGKSGKSGNSGNSEQLPLSICIPRAHKNITSQRVRDTFRRLNLGCIDNVDVVSKTTKDGGEPFVTIYVHFSNWNHDNPEAKKFREKIMKGEQVNIFYDEPKTWFWKCSLNRLRKSHKSSEVPAPAPVAAASAPPPPPPMSPPRLPRWGTAEYMSLFSIVDTINTKK
uniref:Uncharacterized protein n=1 Tax=viral metagenome TaxID=1070528 RepID=A0A6C0F5V1_9ZZZZ